MEVKVTVKLFANFRTGRFSVEERELPIDTTIEAVVTSLGIATKEVGVVMVNGRHAPFEKVLSEGDVLALFPLIGGG